MSLDEEVRPHSKVERTILNSLVSATAAGTLRVYRPSQISPVRDCAQLWARWRVLPIARKEFLTISLHLRRYSHYC